MWCALTLSVLGIVFFIVPNSTWNDVQLGWPQPGPAQVVSVSEDGRWVVSSHADNRIVLWDVEERRSEVVSDDGNAYSAYFISGHDAFLWQGLDGVVRIQDVQGGVIDRFKHLPVYGHVIGSDLETYISADEEYRIYRNWGEDKSVVKYDDDRPAFLGSLLNLVVLEQSGYLLSIGHGSDLDKRPIEADNPKGRNAYGGLAYDGPVLWNLSTWEPLVKFHGLYGKAHGDLSPDGEYVVAADERGIARVWETATGQERWLLASYNFGLRRHTEGGDIERDDSGLIDLPDGWRTLPEENVGVQFVADEWFVRVPKGHPYAALYHIDSPWHQAFFDLGDDPPPATDRYIPSVDATPEAHVLVTGQRYPHGGINVYRFDPETQALETVWRPRGWLRWLQWLDR
ncbi:hypothetical protein SAMN04488052_1241 [Aquisalimonas asiatica]|uniref:WD40 repeat domain-containing protein n=2 Tax=Aquisalimonas asiatica TaxID=406100 RepID=A0A1H8VYD6_9GAMM|nr:hypothetical protein SAMN04488052_1241 [Aquisalimonas asiatica]